MLEKFPLISVAENCGILPGEMNPGPTPSFQNYLRKALGQTMILPPSAILWLVFRATAQKRDTCFREGPRNQSFSAFKEMIF